MKTKLLKLLRNNYIYSWSNSTNNWQIQTKKGKLKCVSSTTHKAVDFMVCNSIKLAFSELIHWYNKVYDLHGEWGNFKLYR